MALKKNLILRRPRKRPSRRTHNADPTRPVGYAKVGFRRDCVLFGMPASLEPNWVTLDSVVALNREEVDRSGEPHELRDPAALQRALAHPWNVWVYFMDRDIAVLAARLYTGVGTARAFAAGNKRTAFRAAAAFIGANCYDLDLPPQRHALDRLLGYFDGRLAQAGVVEWFRLWMTPRHA